MLNDLGTWLQRHDASLDLATVWIMTLTAIVMGVIELASWWELRDTTGDEPLDTTLKQKKRSYGWVFLAWAGYWGIVLAAYYFALQYGFWERLAVRVAVISAMVLGAWAGIRFLVVLKRERKQAGTGTKPVPEPPASPQ